MFPFDAEPFYCSCQHLAEFCPSIVYQTAGQLAYYQGVAEAVVESLERIRDALLAVGMPRPPEGFPLQVPRALLGNDSCAWQPCPSRDHWEFEFKRTVKDCVAVHKALQTRSCALGRERQQAMRDAEKLFADGKDGGSLLLGFERASTTEIGELRKKAIAALNCFSCFKYQIEQFRAAPAADAEETLVSNERPTRRRIGRPRKGENDKELLVIGALVAHHKWQLGGRVGIHSPAKVSTLAELASNEHVTVSGATVSRSFARKFPDRGHKGYASAFMRGEIGAKLALWQGDLPEHLSDLRSHESGRENDD